MIESRHFHFPAAVAGTSASELGEGGAEVATACHGDDDEAERVLAPSQEAGRVTVIIEP